MSTRLSCDFRVLRRCEVQRQELGEQVFLRVEAVGLHDRRVKLVVKITQRGLTWFAESVVLLPQCQPVLLVGLTKFDYVAAELCDPGNL